MEEAWVRGIFFKQVLDYIKNNRGQTSLDMLHVNPENYSVEERYDFEDFCKLLAQIDLMAGSDNGSYISQIARETMAEEARWKMQFRKLDPKNVFITTERQRGRHHIGDFEPIDNGGNDVTIKMTIWTNKKVYQDLWASFYLGRLEGVLELMGRKGIVKMFREFDGNYTYEIKWN